MRRQGMEIGIFFYNRMQLTRISTKFASKKKNSKRGTIKVELIAKFARN